MDALLDRMCENKTAEFVQVYDTVAGYLIMAEHKSWLSDRCGPDSKVDQLRYDSEYTLCGFLNLSWKPIYQNGMNTMFFLKFKFI